MNYEAQAKLLHLLNPIYYTYTTLLILIFPIFSTYLKKRMKQINKVLSEDYWNMEYRG